MAHRARAVDPERRWEFVFHLLFGATLLIPTVFAVLADAPAAARVTTVAIALAFAAWYVALFAARAEWRERPAVMGVYYIGALLFFTVLNDREGTYFLLFYSLLPQAFAVLPRRWAVAAVAALVVAPPVLNGRVDELLRDTTLLFNLLATVGLGLAITALVEAFVRQSERQHETITELEAARGEVAALLERTRRDLRERDVLARTGQGLIGARTERDVAEILADELADHTARVVGVALLSAVDDVDADAAPPATADHTAAPPATADHAAAPPATADHAAAPPATVDDAAARHAIGGHGSGRHAIVDHAVAGTAVPAVGSDVTLPAVISRDGVTLLAPQQITGTDWPDSGVATIAVLPLRRSRIDAASDRPGTLHGPRDPGEPDDPTRVDGSGPDLLWLSLGVDHTDESMLRDLSTVATQATLALENLRLATTAARRGRTAGVLAERQRLAHEIHDTLAQGFTSVVTQLEAAEQALDTDVDVARSHVDRARRTARESLGEARRAVAALRPGPLAQGTLPDALGAVVAEWRRRRPDDVDVALVVDGTPVALADEAGSVLVRVAQESLANVARHASASRVDVTLTYLDDLVLLDVQDDGRGFVVDRGPDDARDVAAGGYGLIAMRERLGGVGGRLVVESTPGDGTTVAARVPLTGGPAVAGTAGEQARDGSATARTHAHDATPERARDDAVTAATHSAGTAP